MTIRYADIPSEDGHWYADDGSQILDVNGRKPTLRDARKHGWVPGITTIIKCAYRHTLESWKQEQLLLAALTLPRRDGEPETEWVRRVWEDSRAQSRAAAERGTAIHAAIECAFQGRPFDATHGAWVRAVRLHLAAVLGPDIEWIAEAVLIGDGYGTKCDLYGMRAGEVVWVIDFKTVDDDAEKLQSRRLYDEHHMQLAATTDAIMDATPATRAAICYISRTEPSAFLVESEPSDLRRGADMFAAMLAYWQAKNRYLTL